MNVIQRTVTAQTAGGGVFELPPVDGSWLIHASASSGRAHVTVYPGRFRQNGREFTIHAGEDRAIYVPGRLPIQIDATGLYSATSTLQLVCVPTGENSPWPSPGYEVGNASATGGNIAATVLGGIVQPTANRVTMVCLASSGTSAVVVMEGQVWLNGAQNYVNFCEIDLATNVGYCTTPIPPGMFDKLRVSSTGSSVNLYLTAWAYEDTGR